MCTTCTMYTTYTQPIRYAPTVDRESRIDHLASQKFLTTHRKHSINAVFVCARACVGTGALPTLPNSACRQLPYPYLSVTYRLAMSHADAAREEDDHRCPFARCRLRCASAEVHRKRMVCIVRKCGRAPASRLARSDPEGKPAVVPHGQSRLLDYESQQAAQKYAKSKKERRRERSKKYWQERKKRNRQKREAYEQAAKQAAKQAHQQVAGRPSPQSKIGQLRQSHQTVSRKREPSVHTDMRVGSNPKRRKLNVGVGVVSPSPSVSTESDARQRLRARLKAEYNRVVHGMEVHTERNKITTVVNVSAGTQVDVGVTCTHAFYDSTDLEGGDTEVD